MDTEDTMSGHLLTDVRINTSDLVETKLEVEDKNGKQCTYIRKEQWQRVVGMETDEIMSGIEMS